MTGRNVSDTLGDGVFQAKICKHKQKLLDLRDSFDDNRWTQQQDKQIGLAVEKLTHIAIDYPDQRNDILDFLVQALNYEHVSTFGHAVAERIIKGIAKFGLECIEHIALDGLAEKYKPEINDINNMFKKKTSKLRAKREKEGKPYTEDDRLKIWRSIYNYPCRSERRTLHAAAIGAFYYEINRKIIKAGGENHSSFNPTYGLGFFNTTYSLRYSFPQRRITGQKPSMEDYKNGAIAAFDALQRITNLNTVSVSEWIGRSSVAHDAIHYATSALKPLCNIIHGHHPSYNPLTGFSRAGDEVLNEHLKQHWNTPDYRCIEKSVPDGTLQKIRTLSEVFSKQSRREHPSWKIDACREILEKGIESIGQMPDQTSDHALTELARKYPLIRKQVLSILESHDTPNARGGLEELRHLEQ